MSDLYIRSHVASGLLVVTSPEQLTNPAILLQDGQPANAPLLSSTQLLNGTWETRFNASALRTWSPDTPILYRLVADGVAERFGYCELQPFENKAILVNGSPIYFRGPDFKPPEVIPLPVPLPQNIKERLLYLTPQEVDTDAWYEELKRLLKEANRR